MIQPNRQRKLPSLTNDELWHFCGERGVYSESRDAFLSCFDVFVHHEGKLYYRMKYKRDRTPVNTTESNSLFKGVTFHDPMQAFMRRGETGEEVAIMNTHYTNENNEDYGEEVDVLENTKTIPYDNFEDFIQEYGLVPINIPISKEKEEQWIKAMERVEASVPASGVVAIATPSMLGVFQDL